MRPGLTTPEPVDDLFRSRLEQIINMRHELVRLGAQIDWAWLDEEIAPCFSKEGRPGVPSRYMLRKRLPCWGS